MNTITLGADITSFADVRRDDRTQAYLRRTMYELLAKAAESSCLPWWDCIRESRGDGAVIVMPPGVRASGVLALMPRLAALLGRANRMTNEIGRLRLRLAADLGTVRSDEHGVYGRPLIHVARMLDAPAFKNAIVEADADTGLLVSDRLFQDAVMSNGPADRDAYRPLPFTCKETRAVAHLWLP